MQVFATTCECCTDVTYHIPFLIDQMSTDKDEIIAHLTDEEMTSLYLELKEYITGMREPEPYHYGTK